MNIKMRSAVSIATLALAGVASQALADCSNLPSRSAVRSAVNVAAANGGHQGGYGLPMWITIADTSGVVCGVWSTTSAGGVVGGSVSVNQGANAGNKAWLGSRVISAQKANTANAFSLDGYSIASGNLWAAVSSGSLYGLQHSNPVDASRAYQGDAKDFGTSNDPLAANKVRIGGINVFGGGLALYHGGVKVGAIGVSGDTSCRDHNFAWDVRAALGYDAVPTGITAFNASADLSPISTLHTSTGGAVKGDELIVNITGLNLAGTVNAGGSAYWNGWSQPACPNTTAHVGTVFVTN